MPLKFDNLEQMIAYLDAKAVEHAHSIYGIILDHSNQSVEQVETILAQLHDHYSASQSLAGSFGLAMFYGAYVGEAIRRNNFPEGTWEGDASGQSFPSLRWYARHGGESVIFQMNWCYSRIVDGPENNVSVKYQVCIMRNNAFVEKLEQLKSEE